MSVELAPLSITNSIEELADWLEIRTFRDRDGNGSHVDLLKTLQISGTADAVDEDEDSERPSERWEDPYEAVVEDAFTEIEDRFQACGGEGGSYPFELTREYIAQREGASSSVYTFLMLLSRFGDRAGRRSNQGAKLFEDICAKAAEAYLGGPHARVKSRVFGFPRRVLPAGFASALEHLCNELQEGLRPRSQPNSAEQKDAKLDIVSWRGFNDARPGQLIAFGQCATGKNWNEKLSEMQPAGWCQLWMERLPAVLPVRMFFVPHRISQREWYQSSVYGGILFDRCRIASHSNLIEASLRTQLAEWSGGILNQIEAI
jgi:hypothetical protein